MLETTHCSALEELAAFAEGRLRGAERERVIAHLAECADCREVLAETVKTAEELDAEDNPAAPVTIGPRRPRFGRPLVASAAAAIAAVGVGALVFWQLDAQRHPPSPAEWLAEMPPARQVVAHTWGGVRLRGGNVTGELIAQSTELGALLVDVRVGVEARDLDKTADALNRMATIIDDAGYMDPNDVPMLRSIAKHGDAEVMRADVLKQLPQLEKRLQERFEPAFLDLGTFAEEVQVAGSAGDSKFLESRRAQRYLKWVLSRPNMALPVSHGESSPLPDAAAAALRTLGRDGASDGQQAAAAQEILDALTG